MIQGDGHGGCCFDVGASDDGSGKVAKPRLQAIVWQKYLEDLLSMADGALLAAAKWGGLRKPADMGVGGGFRVLDIVQGVAN
ncbi:hypothetical protein BJ912DRAFT_1059793 [Pholiota molesta]|nr:hypothetical protein BJ912DRAFT_1059793 [Pholiota molesta]